MRDGVLFSDLTKRDIHILIDDVFLGYEPAGPTMHPPPPKRSRVGSFFSLRYLVLPKFFPQRKSGFCRRY